jgi:hypothetical protein
MDEKIQNAINEFDRAIIRAAENAVSDWEFSLKSHENEDVAAVRCIQQVQVVVNDKERAIGAFRSELHRALHIYGDHILSTIGCPQVLESWLNIRGKATGEIEKVLRLFYELGKKEAGIKDPDV